MRILLRKLREFPATTIQKKEAGGARGAAAVLATAALTLGVIAAVLVTVHPLEERAALKSDSARGLRRFVHAVLAYTGADAIMIGRAAQGRPWIFREIAHFLATGTHLAPPLVAEVRKLLLERDALHIGFGFHFSSKELVLPTGSVGESFFGPDTADDIDGRYGRRGGHVGKSPIQIGMSLGRGYCLNRDAAAVVRRSTGRFAVPSEHDAVAKAQQTLVRGYEYSLRLAWAEL